MSATVSLPLLASVRIASPCSMRWEDMMGNERTRFCSECSLHVHNISEMTAREAEAFLASALGGDRVCARFYRRADGTILTRDCPVGWRAARQRAANAAARVVAALGVVVSAGVLLASGVRSPWEQARLRSTQPFQAICQWLRRPLPVPVVPAAGRVTLMGDVCVSPNQAAALTTSTPGAGTPAPRN